jgi:hypothetical protein
MRSAGASLMVFGWPAFWWLDYYTGLHQHLRSNYRCVLRNDLLIVFDLRSGGGRVWSPEGQEAGA